MLVRSRFDDFDDLCVHSDGFLLLGCEHLDCSFKGWHIDLLGEFFDDDRVIVVHLAGDADIDLLVPSIEATVALVEHGDGAEVLLVYEFQQLACPEVDPALLEFEDVLAVFCVVPHPVVVSARLDSGFFGCVSDDREMLLHRLEHRLLLVGEGELFRLLFVCALVEAESSSCSHCEAA